MPSSPDPIDTSEVILDAALRLFARGGYDGTSLQAIADEVGMRKPSLLYHFPSKDELRLAVLRRVFARWNDVLPRILQAATTGADRFDGLVGEVVSFFAEEPDRARLLLREMLDRPELVDGQMRQYVAPWVAIVTDYIRRGQVDGTVRADADPEAYVMHVVHMIVSGIATATVLGPDGNLDRHVRETVRIARAAIFNDQRQNHG